MSSISWLALIFIAGIVQASAYFERKGAVRCNDYASCFQHPWQVNGLMRRISQHKSVSTSTYPASWRSCSSARAAGTGYCHLSTACRSDVADGSSNEPILEWSLPSGPPLRVISVSGAEHTLSGNSPRDIQISAANGWGDGQHATTSLCLSFLAANAGPNKVSRSTPPPPNRCCHE
jgi:hypothetical protein